MGDCWRDRYDFLRLFSPRWASSLPAIRFPSAHGYPSRDRMADYLEEYVAHFAIPVRTGTRVTRLGREDGRFVLDLDTADGPGLLTADRVVVATGAHRRPVRPPFAATIGSQVRQLHSLEYRSPADLLPGPVLVVGSGNWGTDIALEAAAAGHPTLVAGRFPGQTPVPVDSLRGFVVGGAILFLLRHLTLRTPFGRAAKRRQTGHGTPPDPEQARRPRPRRGAAPGPGRGRARGMAARGGSRHGDAGDDRLVHRLPAGPVLDRPRRRPRRRRRASCDLGVADAVPGLGFVGFDFQYSAASSTLQGMDRDARYVLNALLHDGSGTVSTPVRAASSR